jgi:hypothetical protein
MSIKLLEPQKIKKVEVITHYFKDDENCYGEYTSIEIIVDGELAVEFGSCYDDKGSERAETYLECMEQCGFKGRVVKTEVADYEY